jgi:hypothetical protein
MESKEKIEKLKTFIVENDLQFTEGRRNSDCTVLSGFALFQETEVQECKTAITSSIDLEEDLGEIFEELERVFKYAEVNSYGSWWETEEPGKQWKF